MRFHFSLSTLFWLILVIALSLGWWIDRSRLSKNYKANTEGLDYLRIMVSLNTYNMIQSVTPDIQRWREYKSNSIEDLLVKCKEHAGMLEYLANALDSMRKNAEHVVVK
jgi:hypothetical protein